MPYRGDRALSASESDSLKGEGADRVDREDVVLVGLERHSGRLRVIERERRKEERQSKSNEADRGSTKMTKR